MGNLKYKGYFDFTGGYNDTTNQDLLKDNELSVCENVLLKNKGELPIRYGTNKINLTSKGYNITRRFEYLIRDTSVVLEVYNKKLYKIGTTDTLLIDINSDKPYFLQQQDVLYICDGNEIYELGGKDYFSSIGSVDIKEGDIVQVDDVTDYYVEQQTKGNFYKSLFNRSTIDLKAEDYTSMLKWEDVTDMKYATSNILRPIKAFESGKQEIVEIALFGDIDLAGYITITLDGVSKDINVTLGKTAREIATIIAAETFTGWTTLAKQNIVVFTADTNGLKENCTVNSYNTGLSMVVNTSVNGEDDDNILTEVKKCNKFIYHSKSARYVATGNPNKPYSVYFSEPMQLNYFKEFNILFPTSSEGSPVMMLNMLDSVLIGYKHSFYEYAGIDPATDGTWRRLAIPYGCVSEYSVQVLDLYSFIYLSDNGIYQISANVLNQYGAIMSNNNAVKSISDNVDNTIKSIRDKSKCVSVYHDGIYYLAFNDTAGENNKILLYHTKDKSFSLFTGIQVNDFLYKKDGTLEFASLNYSLKFDETRHLDIDVVTGLDKRIEFEIKTTNLSLDDDISPKFIDKLFIQAKTDSQTVTGNIKTILKIDNEKLDNVILEENASGFAWGEEWQSTWGSYSSAMKSVFIRSKGNRIELTLTNKGLSDSNITTTIYGFAFSYKTLMPYQGFSNINFNKLQLEEKSVLEFMCNDGQYVKGDGIHDDTTGIQKALNSGGIVSFVSDKYTFIVTAELNVPSDTVIDGYNATIKAKSSTTAKNIFKLVDKQNVVIKNLKIKSTKDQVRYSERIGLNSNLLGIRVSANTQNLSNNITLSNIYGENLEYLIKIDDGGTDNFNKNITMTDIKTYDCVQPLYISNADGILMNNLDLDQATDVSKLDHHIYVNGYTYNLEINNVILRRGALDPSVKAFQLSSSSTGNIENVKVTNVSIADNFSSEYVFVLGQRLKNAVIDGFTGALSSTTNKIIWTALIENVICRNFNISGTIQKFVTCGEVLPWGDNGFDNSLTIENCIINATMGDTMFYARNLIIKNNVFNLVGVSSHKFLILNDERQSAKFVIENNEFNVSTYTYNNVLFSTNVDNGTNILINNNTFINNGPVVRSIAHDLTTAGGNSIITISNNRYRGYQNVAYYKTLANVFDNALI